MNKSYDSEIAQEGKLGRTLGRSLQYSNMLKSQCIKVREEDTTGIVLLILYSTGKFVEQDKCISCNINIHLAA